MYFQVGSIAQKKQVEKTCQLAFVKQSVKDVKKKLKDKSTLCTINKETKEVVVNSQGVEYYYQNMLNNENFRVKNLILLQVDKYVNKAKCVDRKVSDTTHNTSTRKKELKKR